MSQDISMPDHLRRGALRDKPNYVQSGLYLIDLMCRKFGLKDMSEVSLLDMGCGTKLSQAAVQFNKPFGQYTGLDLDPEMIEVLREKFPENEYHHLDLYNEMYNTEGTPLSADTRLPLKENSFDYICLYSVFTHLEPKDFTAMLQVMRRYIKPAGKLIFSLYINEQTDNGLGLIDKLIKSAKANGATDLDTRWWATMTDFCDGQPEKPLFWAVYTKDYAYKLMENTGWKIESLNLPEKHIQHYFICSPE
jgi:SAM-dependent methyltransferase